MEEKYYFLSKENEKLVQYYNKDIDVYMHFFYIFKNFKKPNEERKKVIDETYH